jgi:hypothetical protein
MVEARFVAEECASQACAHVDACVAVRNSPRSSKSRLKTTILTVQIIGE